MVLITRSMVNNDRARKKVINPKNFRENRIKYSALLGFLALW